MTDLHRQRLWVRALELLGASYRMHMRGDYAASDRLTAQAVHECGGDLVEEIRLSIVDGETPLPDGKAWSEYLASARATLGRAEEEARADG